MKSTTKLCFAILGALLIPPVEAAASEGDEPTSCRLWLAPSAVSTDRKPKFGLFAGATYSMDDIIPLSELAIPLSDFMEYPNRARSQYDSDILDFVQSFVWTSEYAGGRWEGNYSSTVFVPGIGILSNYHTGHSNVDWLQGSVLKRERNAFTLPGIAHPSRGAITPYYNMTLRAIRTIPAGMELFANFGEQWDGSFGDDAFQDKLTRWEYQDADKLLDKIVDFMDQFGDQMSETLKDDVLDFMLEKVLGTATGKRAKIIKSLIPAHPQKLQRVLDAGGTFVYRNQDLVKSPRWLEDNGICVDKMRGDTSTIPDAGRGAFATQKIAKDELIVPVPMIPVGNKALMDMYEFVENHDEEGRPTGLTYNFEKYRGQQLLVNYCFGHPESSLLLMPVGPLATLINHGSLRDKANAYLTWSKHTSVWNDHSLHDLHVHEVMNQEYPNIVMEIYAIRDIEEGEEIFIDYGAAWEQAWVEYKENWQASTLDGKWPLKAEDMNSIFLTKPFPINLQQDSSPYPDGVATACYIYIGEQTDGEAHENEDGLSIFPWIGPKSFEDYVGQVLTVCDLRGREESVEHGFVYMVRARLPGQDEVVEVKGVPHVAVTLVDQPYQADHHRPGAFRHPIAVEDQRWPQAWRDLRG
jgi:hypothetical protein